MICPKCKSMLQQDSNFCNNCGAKIDTNNINSNTNSDTSIQNDCTNDENAVIYFYPHKIFGQITVNKATIEIHNNKVTTKINNYSRIEIPSGETDLICFANYFGECGKVQQSFCFEGGKTYMVEFFTPLMMFMSGKLDIQAVQPNIENELPIRVEKQKKINKIGIIGGIIGAIVIFAMLNSCDDTTETYQDYYEQDSYEENMSIDGSTAYDFYLNLSQSVSEGEDLYFYLNNKATTFLKNNPSLFPTHFESECYKYTNESISFSHIAKNADKYGDELMFLPYVQVVDIMETELYDNKYCTELNVIDNEYNQYYIVILEELPDIFQGDIICTYGLPLSMTSFTNTDNGITLCPMIAGCYIEKVE